MTGFQALAWDAGVAPTFVAAHLDDVEASIADIDLVLERTRPNHSRRREKLDDLRSEPGVPRMSRWWGEESIRQYPDQLAGSALSCRSRISRAPAKSTFVFGNRKVADLQQSSVDHF